MAANPEVLLNSEEAIAQSMTPFGRQLGVKMEDQYGLFTIAYVDGKQGDVPDRIAGRWTSRSACEIALTGYLRQLWDFSNQKAQKASKPLAHTQSKIASAESQQ